MMGGPAYAQEPPPTGENPVQPEIVVTGQGLPETPASPAYDTVVLTREQLTSSASGRIEDALSSLAGFQQFRRSDSRSANPSAQGVTLRALGGNATSRALVLLDGVPMTDPFFGYIPLSAIAPERLASARITRGGGSGPFGAGALAGTIELTSADAQMLAPVSSHFLMDNRGETEASATLALRLGTGFAMLSGRWDRGAGFWTTPRDQRTAASARARYDSWSMQWRAVAPIADRLELQASGLVFDDRRQLRFKGADSASQGQDASIRLVNHGAWAFDALAYVQARNFRNIVISSTRFRPVLDQRNTPATGAGAKFELRPPVGGNHVFRVGADYRRSWGKLHEDAISAFSGAVTERRSAGGTNTDLGLFIEDDWTSGPLTLTAGMRADRYTIRGGYYIARSAKGQSLRENLYPDRSGWEGSMRGGALVRLGSAVTLRSAAYNGLRLPTLNELYRPFVVFPVITMANPALRNERLEGYEAGIDYRQGGIALSLTAFDNRVKDAIANVTIAKNLRQRQNIDAIQAQGVEASARLARGTVSFDGSLAYTDAVAHGSGAAAQLNGMRPAQTPQWMASGTLGWAPRPDWRLALTARYIGRQFEDDLQSEVLPSAITLGAYAQIPLGAKLTLVLRGENLSDSTIITRNQGGAVDLGVPRTVWIGVKFGS